MGNLFDQMQLHQGNLDAKALIDLYTDDSEFVRHQTGTSLTRSEMYELLQYMVSSDEFKIEQLRCLYENDDILVTHGIYHYPDGTREAVMVVHQLRGGKIARTETGATLLS